MRFTTLQGRQTLQKGTVPRRRQLRGAQIVGDAGGIGIGGSRIQFDQHFASFNRLAVADMDGLDGNRFQRLNSLDPVVRYNLALGAGDDVDPSKTSPQHFNQRKAVRRNNQRALRRNILLLFKPI